MKKIGSMLMVGSTGPNIGKTELACTIIKNFSKGTDITGVKVTTVAQKDGQCPRGGEGCGVCSSLDGSFLITQETNSNSRKDTSRLLAASAKRVFWLRVMKAHLKDGLAALLEVVGPDTVLVCESNSLRTVAEPGLFLMVRRRRRQVPKESAAAVMKYADRIVESDGSNFDFDIERIKLIDGRWTIEEDATAIILAGGFSRRMGVDKSMLGVKDKTMIEHIHNQLCGSFEQILISANEPVKFDFLGLPVVPDKAPGEGPLMAIVSALEASKNDLNFVVACDIPFINLSFVRKMLAEAEASRIDIVVPTGTEQKYEPLFAVYRKSALQAMNDVLSAGARKISDVFAHCRVKYIELGNSDWLKNINTMAEFEEFQKSCNVEV